MHTYACTYSTYIYKYIYIRTHVSVCLHSFKVEHADVHLSFWRPWMLYPVVIWSTAVLLCSPISLPILTSDPRHHLDIFLHTTAPHWTFLFSGHFSVNSSNVCDVVKIPVDHKVMKHSDQPDQSHPNPLSSRLHRVYTPKRTVLLLCELTDKLFEITGWECLKNRPVIAPMKSELKDAAAEMSSLYKKERKSVNRYWQLTGPFWMWQMSSCHWVFLVCLRKRSPFKTYLLGLSSVGQVNF